MFEAHIKYYAYNNIEGDDFGVGRLGNKEFWVRQMNAWNESDGRKDRFLVENWDEFDVDQDMRGCQLAEVAPDDGDNLVTWSDKNKDNTVRISKKGEITWEENQSKLVTVPRWVNRLKTTLRSDES